MSPNTPNTEKVTDLTDTKAEKAAPKATPEHQTRVIEEKKELDAKLEKLIAFNGTEQKKALPKQEADLLTRQENIMRAYSICLKQRIDLFNA